MTIYALSSGPGLSGIAVIRISGSDTKKVLQNMTFLDLPKPNVLNTKNLVTWSNKIIKREYTSIFIFLFLNEIILLLIYVLIILIIDLLICIVIIELERVWKYLSK